MDAKPLKKELYNRAKEAGVNRIILHFSGGSDEGYLDVELNSGSLPKHRDLYNDIEEWAWEVYEYGGAGDGTSYGDTITYDLDNQTMLTQEWYHAVQHGEEYRDTLETQ